MSVNPKALTLYYYRIKARILYLFPHVNILYVCSGKLNLKTIILSDHTAWRWRMQPRFCYTNTIKITNN